MATTCKFEGVVSCLWCSPCRLCLMLDDYDFCSSKMLNDFCWLAAAVAVYASQSFKMRHFRDALVAQSVKHLTLA